MTVLFSHGRGKALAKAAAALAIAGTTAAASAPAWAVLGETQATIHADVQTVAPGAASAGTVATTAARYVDAYQRVTGHSIDEWFGASR